MERRGHGKHHGALGARLRSDLDGAFHRGRVARNHGLVRRIQIRRPKPLRFPPPSCRFPRHRMAKVPGSRPSRLRRPERLPACNCPRRRASFTASENSSAPAATSAEYSPRLCPATKSGVMPCFSSARYAATETVRIAGCVFSVSLRSSSGPSKQSFEIGKPSAASASSKTACDSGKLRVEVAAHAGILRGLAGKEESELAHDGCVFRSFSRARRTAAAAESSCSIFSFTRERQSSAATRMAFLMALGFDRPCPMMVMPRTPSSGAPPYSE